MVDACGQRVRGPPSIFHPYQKYCFTPAFTTLGDSTFTPCVSSALAVSQNIQPPTMKSPHGTNQLPPDFTPVAVSTAPAAYYNMKCKGKWQCKQNLIETVVDGKRNLMCPVSVAQNLSTNCKNTMKSIWQCDRFLAKGDLDGYNKCRQMEKCFQYDIMLPDGNIVPIAVKANDVCLAAAQVALQQGASECVNEPTPLCTYTSHFQSKWV